jgi:uncharacterized integral membrane protein (TIGR00698 family)
LGPDRDQRARSFPAAGVLLRDELPGVLFCAALAGLGWLIARLVPQLSTAAVAILLGSLLGNLLPGRSGRRPGVKRSAGPLLEATIVLMGLTIPLTGLPSPTALLGLLIVMTLTLAFAAGLGRLSGLGPEGGLLAGIGTAVCGSAAIAASAPLLRVPGALVAAALASINLLSASAMFVLPALGSALGMDDTTMGWWTGGSLQAMGQAVGAGFAFSDAAGETATTVKLFRVATLAVFLPVLALARGGSERRGIPWFVAGFLVAIGVAAVVDIPGWVSEVVRMSLAVALAGIGAQIDPAALRSQGPRVLAVCALAFLVQLAGVVTLRVTQAP